VRSVPTSSLVGQWDPRVQVDGHIEFADCAPERFHTRLVEVSGGVLVADVGVPVDRCADASEVPHGPLELGGGRFAILQRCREHAQPLGVA